MRWDVRNCVILCAGIFYLCHTCDTAGSQADCQGILQVPCPSYNKSDPTSQLRCIHPSWICDTESDCPDGSDEKNCGDCGRDLFRCQEAPYTCVPNSWKCDGEVDCDDGSDESQCVQPEYSFPCKQNEIRCAIGLQCIPLEHLCYTDKLECILDDSFCLNFNCLKTDCGSDSWCAETPSGAKCYCENGKTFNETKCVDLDECQYDTYCDQPRLCTNKDPGFTCGCIEGYELGNDNRSCLAVNASGEAQLIVLNDGKILQLYANGTSLPRYFYIEELKATSLTFDYQGNKICWIGRQGGKGVASLTCVMIQDLQDIPQISDLLVPLNTSTTLSTVEQVTLDWVTNNWYMTDPHFKRIVVCSRDGTKCKAVLDSTSVSGPKSLAIDPTQGYMFFIDWDSHQSYIRRANLDGSDLQIIQGNSSVKNKLVKPTGLTLDYANQHVYWTDRDLNLVTRVDYDGSKKRVIYFGSLVKNVFGVSMLQNYLYLTDPFDKTISRIHRYDYNEAPKLLKDSNSLPVLTAPQHIEVFHQQRQPSPKWKNPCNDLKCKHLCLLTRDSKGQVLARCECSAGFKLTGSNNCSAKPECLSSNSDDYNEGCSLVRCHGDFSYCTTSDLCLPSEWWCDGKKDCPDGSDENEYCNFPSCDITQFTCTNRRCIDLDFVCDLNDDCGDNSDEVETACGKMCAFDCKDNTTASSNSTCLKKSQVCDGHFDCANKLDEKNCNVEKRPCETLEFRCGNGECIPKSYNCDGDRDCLDGLDEVNCSSTIPQCDKNEQYACHNSTTTLCIPRSWICDKEKDCPDGADEANCSTTTACEYNLKCQDGSTCLNFSQMCDGKEDCSDTTDEGGNCSKKECDKAKGGCSDNCTNTPSGHICHCPIGKKLNQTDSKTCIAENPCEQWGICSQTCILDSKAVNGYRCSCSNGYLEPDNYTCKPLESDPVYVVFSNRHEIRRVDVMTNSYVSLISGLRNTIALDFYYNDSKVYLFWTDVMDDKIYRGIMMGNGIINIETVIDSGLATTEGLAVDWVGGNIYWVESNLDQIEVAKLDGSLRTTLVAGEMISPRAIVVDPRHGALFWTDWDGLNPRIEGCSMSGEGRKVIHQIQPKEGGGWPNGLTLDYDFSRLYWIDARSESVHTIKYDGSDYRLVLKDHKDMSHPFAISLFGIHFYWTDWSTNSVVRANKFTGSDITTIQQTVTQPFDLQVVHPLRQVRSHNPCGNKNGNCSHLCLLSYNGTVGCHCPHQKKLDPKDNKTCIDDNKFLLFVRSAEVRGVDLENAHYNVIPVITIPHVDNPSSIDFDQSDGLYWADTGLNMINRANVNGSDVETIIDSGLLHPEGLAIDWISSNIYFSSYDDKSASISVATLNGTFRTEIIKTETFKINQPHSLAVHPSKGLLFWADKMNKTKIFKAYMDGSKPDTFVDGLTNPYSLAVDMKENLLIFIDDIIIKKCHIENQTCSQITTSITFMPMAVTIHEDYLYVSTGPENTNQDSIIRFNRDGTGNKTLRSQTAMIKALRVYDKEWRKNGTYKNGCTRKKCSQLCLPVGETTTVCRCTAGYSLSDNDTSCVGIKSFLMYAKESEIRGISFEKNDSVEALPPISKIQMASAVDFHAANDFIYWADTKSNSILRIKRDLSGRETILKDAISSVEGLAVDWIAGNVYWTDADHDTIEVSRLNGSNRYVLLSGSMEKPRSIAVHPAEGVFFWADWGSEPKIEKACLDGSNRTTFVSGINITTPYGLTIDYETNMLYWCDKSLDIIEKVNILTGDRTLIVHDGITDCMSMTVFKDYIYWIDTTDQNGAVKKAKKTDGSSVEYIRQSLGTRLKDIKAFDAERQKGTNPCATNNGGCEQLCFYVGKSRPVSCRCSFGKLINDTHCGEHHNFLLYSRVTAIESIDLDENNKNPPIEPIVHETKLRNVIGLAFDYATQTIFFSDIQRAEIQSIYFNGSGLTTVIEGIGSAEGLAFDSSNSDLYYTSYTNSCISRINMRSKIRKSYTVMQMSPRDRLRAITVDSCGGMMYWTNWHDDKPGIHRATLNGLYHEQIISTEIRTPNGLSIDHPAQKLYWSDARLDKIERCNLDGTNRITLITSIPQHSFGLTIYQNYIYWTDWMLRGVLRANKHDGHGVIWLRKNLDRQPMAIIAVAADSTDCGQNQCYKNQYGCKEKCLLSEMGEPYCECNSTRILGPDGKTCIPDANCTAGDFTCTDGIGCVSIESTCNEKIDCKDGSDENKTYCENRICPLGMFTCSSPRQCIAGYKRCNGEVNCRDLSDEKNCMCGPSQFKCNNGKCIDAHNHCNRIKDCEDFSDEIRALCTGLPACPTDTWSCINTTDCLVKEKVCDGTRDCMDGSDEINCTAVDHSCQGGFKCTKSGECIFSLKWRCDKDEDCDDGSDESNCTYNCDAGEFQCKNGHCIDSKWKCDGYNDCLDASDEITCSNKTCSENEFKCLAVNGTGRCIAAEYKCDGDPDCENGEDESVENGCPLILCSQDDFQCKNLRCVDKIFVCDHDDDCGDRSDEPATCIYEPCRADQFQCNNGICIDKKYQCDGTLNCPDKSDEWNCTTCEAPDKFQCNNSKCISENMTCNGKNDCEDNSDEPFNCNVKECDIFPCSRHCVEKKIGYLCTCDPGYELGPDNKTCQDLDECAKEYPCTHYCHNIIGSYYCTCAAGFILLPDKKRCKDNSSSEDHPFLLVSNRYYIRKIYLDGTVELLLDHLNHSVAIDYDYKEKKLYWSDITSQFSSINRRSFNCDNSSTNNCIETLHSTTVRNPDGIAVDWIGRNLYWCDRNTDTVEVSKLDGRFRKILINDAEFLREPRALQVFPAKGFLFLTDWGDRPHISRVAMDGSSKSVIIKDEIAWPNALTIDYVTEKIFWADAYYDYMAMADLDGSKRHVILRKDLPHVFAMTTFINKIFWTDWETKSIYQVNKFSGENRTQLATLIHRPMDIVVYHHTRQEQFDNNPCERKNCTHLCLLRPPSQGSGVQAVCACPENHNLMPDGKSCSSNCTSSQMLCEKSSKCIPFWWKCDNHADCEDASDEPSTCSKYHCLQPGMFQCKSATGPDDCITAMQICDGTKDCQDGSDEINCSNYTCMSHQFKCVTENACISDTKRCNGVPDCKDGADEKNCPNITCQDNQFQCNASKKCIPYLWYCDKDNDCLDWSDEPASCHEAQCKENFIKCNISGRCILKEWQCDGDVDCGTGDESDEDYSTCHAQTCDPTFFKCRNNHCIPGRWRCDYDKDCTDGSDEVDCEYRNCSESEFQCKNNKCIPRNLQCNHKMDCEDASDETNCTMNCLPSQFHCADKLKCIPESWKCDGDEDCNDGSDEICGANNTCGQGEFQCKHASCISSTWQCDGDKDCQDGSDEDVDMCKKYVCPVGTYQCKNQLRCVHRVKLCDGKDDCGDKTDEDPRICRNKDVRCTDEEFHCPTSFECLPMYKVCDGKEDCADKQDENKTMCTHTKQCVSNKTCDHNCTDIIGVGIKCSCRHGYVISDNGFNCTVIDPCSNWTLCPQRCIRGIYGWYKCVCDDGYLPIVIDYQIKVGDSTTIHYCIAKDEPPHLLIAQENTLLHMDVRTELINGTNASMGRGWTTDFEDEQVINKIEGIDVDVSGDKNAWVAFFSSKSSKSIKAIHISDLFSDKNRGKRSYASATPVIEDLQEPRGIAVDWIGKFIYFVDSGAKKIYMVQYNGMKKITVISRDLSEPFAIAVDPRIGRIYWTDRGFQPKIEVANLAGQKRRVLVNRNLVWPSSLAIDYPNRRLYWTDLKMSRIETVNLDGSDRQISHTFPSSDPPYMLDVFEDYLYVTTYRNNHLLQMHKFYNLSNIKKIIYNSFPIGDVVIAQKHKQQTNVTNYCAKSNCSKSQCINLPDDDPKFTCICPTGALVGQDKCEFQMCPENYCYNNGTCSVINENLKCKCPPTHKGIRCETVNQEYCQNYCYNEGNCSVVGTTRQCTCPLGYIGNQCESCTQINNNPCSNGGICHLVDKKTPTCVCPPGYSSIDNCKSLTCEGFCRNGGTCVKSSENLTCMCSTDYKGTRCDEVDKDCTKPGNTCQNGGTCDHNTITPGKCTCPKGFKGILCETLSCDDYCENGGTCTIENQKAVCRCSPFFSGTRCESCVCVHGNCSTERNTTTCICDRLYKSLFCNVSVCNKYCFNGGECVNCTVNQETLISECQECRCKPGLTGSRCTKIPPQLVEIQQAGTELAPIVIPVLVSILVLLAIVVFIIFRRRRNNQFRHHLMKGNADLEVSNPMYAPQGMEEEDDESRQPFDHPYDFDPEKTTNFANPMYETFFSDSTQVLLAKEDEDNEERPLQNGIEKK